MNVLLSRNINGAVNVGNTDLILPLRVRARRENAVKTPASARGSVASASQRWGVAKRPDSVALRGSVWPKGCASFRPDGEARFSAPAEIHGRLYAVILPVILWVMRAVTWGQGQTFRPVKSHAVSASGRAG